MRGASRHGRRAEAGGGDALDLDGHRGGYGGPAASIRASRRSCLARGGGPARFLAPRGNRAGGSRARRRGPALARPAPAGPAGGEHDPADLAAAGRDARGPPRDRGLDGRGREPDAARHRQGPRPARFVEHGPARFASAAFFHTSVPAGRHAIGGRTASRALHSRGERAPHCPLGKPRRNNP